MHVIANCRAKCDYERKDPSELSLKVGDVIEVLKKGKYIWYGRLDDAKGFFPAVAVEDLIFNEEIENPLSSTAVVDNGKGGVVASAAEIKMPMDSKKSDETFGKIESTSLLEDKRRSRPRSAGRPPSQVFIKENILQKSENMENLSNESDDDENKEQEREILTTSTKITTVSQLVTELKQKPNLKAVMQKDITGSSTINVNSTDNPAWMKALPKKKVSVPEPNQKSDNANKIPPWMQEIRKRREHKLSLKSDDDVLRKVGQEFRSFQENMATHTSVEIKNVGTTRTTNHVTNTEETSNIQTKSVSLEAHEEKSTNTILTASEINVNQTYSSIGSNLDKNMTPLIDDITNNIKNIESLIETQTSTPLTKTIPIAVAEVINSSSAVSHTSANSSTSTEQSKYIKDAKDNTEKIEPPNEAEVTVTVTTSSHKTLPPASKQTFEFSPETRPEQVKLAAVHSTENNENLERKNKNAEKPNDICEQQSPNSLTQLSDEEKITNSVQLLLNVVDTFEAQYKIRSLKILEDIKKMEATFNQQNQGIKIFIDAMKVKLSALVGTKH